MENDENRKKKNILQGPSFGYSDIFPTRELWKEVAKELNGEFHARLTASNENEIHNISIPYKKWMLQISVSDTRPLKFNVLISLHQEFELNISWEDFMDRIGKKFGSQDIELASKEFDKHYIIKSNKPHLVKGLISKEIQDCFLKYDIYSLMVHSLPGSTNAEMTCVIQKTPGNKEMLLELIHVFKLLIDNLEKERMIR